MHDKEVAQILEQLKLVPLPEEGGLFKETFRSALYLQPPQLPAGYSGPRSLCTAIYYLLTPGNFSALHRLPGDEIFHFYLGDPVEMLELHPDGSGRVVILGHDFRRMRLQHVVGGGVWQGCRLVKGGKFALMGTTMSPGFAFEDFTLGIKEELCVRYPDHREHIMALVR